MQESYVLNVKQNYTPPTQFGAITFHSYPCAQCKIVNLDKANVRISRTLPWNHYLQTFNTKSTSTSSFHTVLFAITSSNLLSEVVLDTKPIWSPIQNEKSLSFEVALPFMMTALNIYKYSLFRSLMGNVHFLSLLEISFWLTTWWVSKSSGHSNIIQHFHTWNWNQLYQMNITTDTFNKIFSYTREKDTACLQLTAIFSKAKVVTLTNFLIKSKTLFDKNFNPLIVAKIKSVWEFKALIL